MNQTDRKPSAWLIDNEEDHASSEYRLNRKMKMLQVEKVIVRVHNLP